MDDVEYILRIILRARDEMAGVLAKARTQLRGFTNDSKNLNTSMDALNKSMDSFNKNMDGVTKKLQAWRAVLHDAQGDSDKATKSLDGFAKSAERTVTATKKATETYKQLQDRARTLRNEVKGITEARDKEAISAKFAASEYERLAKQLEAVSLKMSDAARTRTPAAKWAEEARQAANAIVEAGKRQIASDKEVLESKKRTEAEFEKIATNAQKLADKTGRVREQAAAREAKADADRATAARKTQEEIVRLEERAAAIRERIAQRRGKGEDRSEDIAELKLLTNAYSRLSRNANLSADEQRRFGAESERLSATMRINRQDAERSSSAFSKLSATLKGSGENVSGFDNQLRGMGIFAAVASAQQLISAVFALGGELVSLAGSAAMAGGALGGILAAGAAQALPVVGLLMGAVQSLAGVMEAMTAQQALQKAQFTDAEKSGQKAVDQANTLANAQDTVASANDNLAESRKALTKAQKDGVEQLEDLIYAEKQAALAAKGAALDVKAAQEALRLAVREGASQLELDQKRQALAEARQSRGRAGTEARRATGARRAAGGDVGNLESVQSAAKAVQDAEKAVDRANRGLDQAADKADRAAASTMTAAANLNFLLSQMSPAERKLYEALQSIYDTYKRIFQGEGTGGSGIYGVIVNSFTRAVEQVEKIMKMPTVISAVQDLADVIGENIDKIVDAFDPSVIEQMVTIIGDAGENLGPLVDMAIKLGLAFLNIAETANPAFQSLLEYLGPIVDKFLAMTADKDKMTDFFNTGEEHLESWIDLVLSVIRLFAILFGASMDDGKKSVEDLTDKINEYSDKLEENIGKVKKFFNDAREAAYKLAGVVENLGATLFDAFDPKRVENLAGLLNDVVIPAIDKVTTVTGVLVDALAAIASTPAGAFFLQVLLVGGLLAKVFGGLVGIFLKFTGLLEKLGILKLAGALGRATGATEALTGAMGGLRVAMLAAFGPIPLIIAGVVIAIVALLAYFDKFDDIWKGIQEGFAEFMSAIQPAIENLQEALEGFGVSIGTLEAVMGVLKVAGEWLAEFIATYLVEVIKGLFKVLSGVAIIVIDTIAGVIKVLHGLADLIIGVFTLDWDQIKKGWFELRDGLYDFVDGILKGIGKILEGLYEIFMAPFKAAWEGIKGFFGIKSPSKKAKELGKDIIDGIRDGIGAVANFFTRPFRQAWNKLNDWFDGKPKKLAEGVIDEFTDRLKTLWRRLRAAASYLWEKFKDGFDAAKKFGGTIINAIVDGVKGLPAALMKAITDIGGLLVDVGKAIGGKIVDGLKAAFGAAKDVIGSIVPGGGDDKKDDKKPAARPAAAPTVKFDIGVGAIPFGAKDLKDAENIYGNFWKELRKTARESTDYIQRQFREMRIATTGSSDKMYKDIRASLRDIQNSFKVRGAAVSDTWDDNWQNINKVAYDGLDYIGSQTNKMLKGLSEKHINFGLTAPKKEEKGKAGGGFIGKMGQRGRDVGLYPLGAGEAVLNWAHQRYIAPAVEAFYGHPFEATFDRVHAYHAGGKGDTAGFAPGGIVPIPGSPGEFIHKSILKDVVYLRDKYKLHISDGYAPTGHAASGEHPKGLAIDAGPGPGGSWDIVDQLAHWAEPTQNAPRKPFRWVGYDGDHNHGRGNHIHLSWAAGQTLGAVGDIVTSVARRIVSGPDGGYKTILQSAIDMVRKVANKFIEGKSSVVTTEGAENVPVGNVGAGAGPIFKFFKQHGFTDEQAAAWVGNFQQESGLNPAIVQPNGEGHGLAQWGHGRFDALVAFAKSHDKPWQDMGVQLAFVMHELAGAESAAYQAIKAAKSVLDATNAIGSKYERYGISGDRSGPAMDAYRKFAGKYDVGGEIPGSEGEPVPILAHAREWVLNPKQQGFLASLIGTGRDTLKAMLGFTGGPISFQGGGEIKRGTPTVKSTTKRLEDILADANQLDSFGKSLDSVRLVMRGINRLGPKIKNIGDIVDVATKEGGFLDNLRAAIERRFAAANLLLRRRQLTVGTGRVVRQAQDAVRVAEDALAQRRGERRPLTDERREIQKEFDAVESRRKKAKKGSELAKDLASQQILLQTRLDEANERVIQNTEDIFSAQEEVARAQEEAAQKRLDAFQAITDSIKDRYTKAGNVNERFRRVATALGNTEWLKQAADAQANLIGSNINDLIGQLHQARRLGYTEQAAQLEEDIADLYASATELAATALKDAADVIGNAATRRGAALDLFGRMADAMGLVGQGASAVIPGLGGVGGLGAMSRGQVAQGRIQSAIEERAGYAALLPTAQAQGNVGMVAELIDKINGLTVEIVELTKSERDARFAASAGAFDYATSINDLNKQLVEATDAVIGQTSSAELLRLANERQTLLADRTAEIQRELDEAIAAGDQQATQDLTKELLQNKIAVQQNTKAVNELVGAGSEPATYTSLAWQWFRTAFMTGTGGIMPQYTPPVMQEVGTIGPGGGTIASTNGNGGGTTINTSVEINEAGQPINATEVASTVVYAQATSTR